MSWLIIWPINQSINQSMRQSINKSSKQSINPSTRQSINKSINQSANASINQSLMFCCFGSSSNPNTMHGPQQLRFNAIITVSLRLISQLPLFAMPGGVADLCLAGWMSTAAGDTLYTVEVATDSGTPLCCLPRL